MARLGDICKFQSGGTPSKSNPNFFGGNIPWVTTVALNGGIINSTNAVDWITNKAIQESAAKIVPQNSIMVGTRVGIGKVAINAVPMSTSQDVISLLDIDTASWDKGFLCKFIVGKNDFLLSQARGATIKGIKIDTLSNLQVPDIPLEEQRRIAALLDKVSDLIAKRRAQLDKLDLLVKARFVEMFGDPVSNEKNWTNVSLGDIAEIRIGPFGSLLHKEDYITGGHALVNPSHIIDGQICVDENLTISDEKYDELSAYQLEVDDIVLGRRGEMGRCAVVHQKGLLCGTGSIIIRPNVLMKPYFLQNIISNPTYKKIIEDKAVGVTMMNLNVPIVSELKVPLLPVHLQEQFIDFMDQVDKSKLTIQQSLDKLETLKKAMMQQYFDEHGANRRFREI